MISVEHRLTAFSEPRYESASEGKTIEEIVTSLPRGQEYLSMGTAFINGHSIPRANWGVVRPKSSTSLSVTILPRGGGGGGDSKNVFTMIAAIAVLAVTAFVSGGGIGFLAPSLKATFGAGTIGASLAGAAVGALGTAALALMSRPAVGAGAGGGGSGSAQLGNAGISQNSLGAFAQVPAVRGSMRVTPPLLARPYTFLRGIDQEVHAVCGVCGPCLIEDIKINGIDISDWGNNIEYEVRQGLQDDAPITLVDIQGFEENLGQQMSVHGLEDDLTIIKEPYASNYPRPIFMRTCRNADAFKVTALFPGGLFDITEDYLYMPIRMRIKLEGTGTWHNLPEVWIYSKRQSQFRLEFWIDWSGEIEIGRTVNSPFKAAYFKNPEWEAHAHFSPGVEAIEPNAAHVGYDGDSIRFYLDAGIFPKGKYVVEMTRGAAVPKAFNISTYQFDGDEPSAFTRRSTDSQNRSLIIDQSDKMSDVVIQNHGSFRYDTPILASGLAMIAVKGKMQIQSISAKFTSMVPTWDGASWTDPAPSSNPAELLRDVLLGPLNPRPVRPGLLEDLSEFQEHCENENLECNTLVNEGTVDQVCNLMAMTGEAALRRSAKWGVTIDRDRSGESIRNLFSVHNMVSGLTIRRGMERLTDTVYATYLNADNDYLSEEVVIYDDDVDQSSSVLVESLNADGKVTVAEVERHNRLNMRRARLRRISYTFDVRIHDLANQRGDLVGLSHDILAEHVGSGRVVSWTTTDGNITSITLNTELVHHDPAAYAPQSDFFDHPDLGTVENIFGLTSTPETLGIAVELADGSTVVLPIASVDGAVLHIDGEIQVPDGMTAKRLAAVGPLEKVVRRCIIVGIDRKTQLKATLTLVDEAPAIYEGF